MHWHRLIDFDVAIQQTRFMGFLLVSFIQMAIYFDSFHEFGIQLNHSESITFTTVIM